MAQQMFSGTSGETWSALLTSGYVIGAQKSTLTRGRDIIEDYDINFINPNISSTNYWGDFYTSNPADSISRSGYPLVTVDAGPQANKSLFGNDNLIAMGDDSSLWYDADGSLSRYSYAGGTLIADYTWTAFTGGTWAGQQLSNRLNLFIGYEEGYLHFLDGDNAIISYAVSGVYASSCDIVLSGDLAGKSLGDIVDGKEEGYTYLGWDVGPILIGVTIPEPSTYVLLAGIGLAGIFVIRRRRRNS
jgi:hypothetical protein